MFARLWLLSLVVIIVAAYFISRDRKLKFEVELEIEPEEEDSD